MDLISLKTFMNEGIRWSSNNEKFQFWLPAYFGDFEDAKEVKIEEEKADLMKKKMEDKILSNANLLERFVHLSKKAVSMIMTNSTKRFKPLYILELYPKILLTLVLLII